MTNKEKANLIAFFVANQLTWLGVLYFSNKAQEKSAKKVLDNFDALNIQFNEVHEIAKICMKNMSHAELIRVSNDLAVYEEFKKLTSQLEEK